jgi:hypothetical protein
MNRLVLAPPAAAASCFERRSSRHATKARGFGSDLTCDRLALRRRADRQPLSLLSCFTETLTSHYPEW